MKILQSSILTAHQILANFQLIWNLSSKFQTFFSIRFSFPRICGRNQWIILVFDALLFRLHEQTIISILIN